MIMRVKKRTLVLIVFSVSSLMISCTPEEIEKTGETVDVVKTGKCMFTVPKKMRALRKTYNEKFSAPDSEGNAQSYGTCIAGLEAAKDYQSGLDSLRYYMEDYCANNENVDDHWKKISKTEDDLARQVRETNCESVYGK